MPDFVLQDDQNVDCAVQILDDAGGVVPGVTLDAGSLIITVSDTTVLQATVSADQTSVNVKALGPLGTGITVTPAATINGSQATLTGVAIAFDVSSAPATKLGLVPGTPTHN